MLEPSDLIREAILSTLPKIPVKSLSCMVEKLIQQGVETEDDLQYVIRYVNIVFCILLHQRLFNKYLRRSCCLLLSFVNIIIVYYCFNISIKIGDGGGITVTFFNFH